MEKKVERKKAAKKAMVKKESEAKPVAKKVTAKKAAAGAARINKTPLTELKAAAFFAGEPSLVSSQRPLSPNPPSPSPENHNHRDTAPSPGLPQSYWQDRYGEDRMVLMIRDPYWCFAYWDLTSEKQSEVIGQTSNGRSRLLLRVYDVTGVDFNGSNAHRFVDIEISPEATNWYINVWAADRSYCVDLGLLYPDGRFVTLVRSNIVTTPRDSISPIIDDEWMVVDETFDRLYKAAGANEWGRSSEALTKYMMKRVRADVTSGGLGSMGSAGGRPRMAGVGEDFWLVVHTELIVYGATEPDAKVTIQGKPIQLNLDGTFSARFALPDGKQEIPVKAVKSTGTQERQITPVVEKRTE